MLSPPRRRQAVLLLIATLLTSSAAWAARGPGGRSEQPANVARPSLETILGRAWNLLVALWDREGCNIDPSGHCVNGPAQNPPPQPKAGCEIDPNGRCVKVPAQNTEIGCNIDPNGHCIS